MDFEHTPKMPGKTEFSGRRRTATRRAGFKSHPESTGAEFKVTQQRTIHLEAGEPIFVSFFIPPHRIDDFVAYGGWYLAPRSVRVSRQDSEPGRGFRRHTLVPPGAPNWSKFGAMARSADGGPSEISFIFEADTEADVAFFELGCGVVHHEYLATARPSLLKNMYEFSPEAHFFSTDGEVVIDAPEAEGEGALLYLKSCNRCARFLPINLDNELIHLSFSNHCKAEHRLPCSHSGFGKLVNVETQERIRLGYGYQLECRFCKKFEVNSPHNPQRTPAQRKEDGARRRALELLLTGLFGQSPQLSYRHQSGGRELSDDVWKKFEGKCFNCKQPLEKQEDMRLDHTRPLALLWPLDGGATCLCVSCNSQKRDRPPVTFYTQPGQLEELSEITGIPLADLQNPAPNLVAIRLLQSKLAWFFDEFCQRPDLTKERDGKVAVELLFKALQKTLNKCPGGAPFNLVKELERHRK